MSQLQQNLEALNEHLTNMGNMYDEKYKNQTLSSIDDDIQELEKWSIWNKDKGNIEIAQLRIAFDNARNLLKK